MYTLYYCIYYITKNVFMSSGFLIYNVHIIYRGDYK